MKIPSAGKQITLLQDDSLSKNLKLVSIQPPARQAVIYMTMWVPELSFPYLKVGGTKTNHTEASVLKKTDVGPLFEVGTAIQIYQPVCRTWNWFLFFSSTIFWPFLLFLTVWLCLSFLPRPTQTHFPANAGSSYTYFDELHMVIQVLPNCIKIWWHQEIDVFPTANKHWSLLKNNVKKHSLNTVPPPGKRYSHYACASLQVITGVSFLWFLRNLSM